MCPSDGCTWEELFQRPLRKIIHTGSVFTLDAFSIEGSERKRLEPGAALKAGTTLQVAESPNPICLVDTEGNLISRNMWCHAV